MNRFRTLAKFRNPDAKAQNKFGMGFNNQITRLIIRIAVWA